MLHLSCALTAEFDLPDADSRTMRARNAMRWDVFGRRARSSSFSRSSSVSPNSFKGRPIRDLFCMLCPHA
jgi:hypothetical protein